jgi:hypothetical protein
MGRPISQNRDAATFFIARRRLWDRVANRLGITPTAVRLWRKVPAMRVSDVARLINRPRWFVRPDVFDATDGWRSPMNDNAFSLVSAEFKLWGVKFESRMLNGGHIEVIWQASPDREIRRHVLSKTPSDWRTALNDRSRIRRLLKYDGLKPLPLCTKTKPKPSLAKALELPQPAPPVETDADQIKILRAEIGDLTDLVLDLVTTIKNLSPASSPAPVAEIAAPVIALPAKTTRVKIIEHVTKNWNSTETIARDAGLTKEMAYRKLYYLSTTGKVQLSPMGLWRLTPEINLHRANGSHAVAVAH